MKEQHLIPSINPTTGILINNKKTITAWSFYDWANSAFALVITVAIFPSYFISVTEATIPLWGWQISNSALYAYAISFSYLVIALLSPLLSGIADSGGRRMFFLRIFTVLGSSSCIALFLFTGMDNLWFGTIAFILALIGFSGGLVFYNSYLHDIVSSDHYDQTSAKGYAYGYIGSVILLIINLAIILNFEYFGLKSVQIATRLSFLMVGLWWIGFALIPFTKLPRDSKTPFKREFLKRGTRELKKVWNEVKTRRDIKVFLLSFFFYSAGVQTLLFLAVTFAEKELAFGTSQLITVILVLQILGIAGGYLFAFLSKKMGNINAILLLLFTWMSVCFAASFVYEQFYFYIMSGFVGLLMGGIQALSRSTYAKLVPEQTKDVTSYFSFYDVLEKIAIVLGTFIFGFIDQLFGNMRISILFLAIFFIAGIILLYKLKRERIAL
ncbi:MAG: MFS transporter [Saprospiraceae bacterium]